MALRSIDDKRVVDEFLNLVDYEMEMIFSTRELLHRKFPHKNVKKIVDEQIISSSQKYIDQYRSMDIGEIMLNQMMSMAKAKAENEAARKSLKDL